MNEDVEIEVAAAAIRDLLFRVSPDKRAAALAKASARESAEREAEDRDVHDLEVLLGLLI
jgi:hypothetical protein